MNRSALQGPDKTQKTERREALGCTGKKLALPIKPGSRAQRLSVLTPKNVVSYTQRVSPKRTTAWGETKQYNEDKPPARDKGDQRASNGANGKAATRNKTVGLTRTRQESRTSYTRDAYGRSQTPGAIPRIRSLMREMKAKFNGRTLQGVDRHVIMGDRPLIAVRAPSLLPGTKNQCQRPVSVPINRGSAPKQVNGNRSKVSTMSDLIGVLSPNLPKRHLKTLAKLKRRYQPLQVLGQGAYSVIYLAKDSEEEKLVALKIAKQSTNTLLREYQCLKRLDDAGIVKALAYINASGAMSSVLVQEYAGSHSLKRLQLLEPDKRFPEDKVVKLASHVIKALAHAHSRNVAHCDLKEENVVYDPTTDSVKLIDFGFADVYTTKAKDVYHGTPNYMAPQILLRKPYSPFKADVWALGVMLYKLKFSTLPYTANNQLRLLDKIRTTEVSFNRAGASCSPRLQKFIEKLLTVNEGDRVDMATAEATFNELFKHCEVG